MKRHKNIERKGKKSKERENRWKDIKT